MEDDKIIISLTDVEFNYISDVLVSLYKNLKKLPKKMRTPKFYMLENMVNNHFNKNNLHRLALICGGRDQKKCNFFISGGG